ncbi:hypothetical protein NM208_g941 [Fusarium decemcellulare]|uniref:Uncharacterized protein n=1 Tax=Fusarium decemcellulare TaxID=57161 RepID=A0ACC1SXM8_9HYPO|nr:hypothetical protein NM208_g941 [Fusarium decemcellulare]
MSASQSGTTPPTQPAVPPSNAFQRALKDFESRLKPSEISKFKATALDDLKVTILAIQSEQRSRKQMMHMGRIMSFLEAMEQFGKVIEVFLNVADMLAFIWGPVKLLLLTAASWSESFDTLLDAYQLIAENFPIFESYQSIFPENERMRTILECAWSNILDFHIQALRIFEQSMLRQFFRSLWRDFKSRFQGILNDLKRQKEIVQSHANQLHIQHYEADRLKIFEELEQAHKKRLSEKRAFVAQWIAAPQVILDHEHLCQVRQEQYDATQRRTATWILGHEEVKTWLAPPVPKSSSLWINAIAGAGKSILTSVLVDEILQQKLAPAAYFYCKHGDPKRKTLLSFLKAALSQLITQQDQLIPYYYEEASMSGETELQSTKHGKTLMRHMLQNIPKAFLVIDGLDECDDKERRFILDFLREVIGLCDSTTPGKLRVLVLSRDEPDIRKALAAATVVRFGRHDTLKDIESYAHQRARLLQRKFTLSDSDREYIEQYVSDKSDGMFLFAKLVMMNLERQPNLYYLREEFDNLPNGLDQAYGRNLHRIQSNPYKNEREMAQKILSLVICCRRPLEWRELQSAISINPIDQEMDATRRLSVDVQEICGSLIEVNPEGRVEFMHMTASMYLQDSGYVTYAMAENVMTGLCLHYLSFECFEDVSDDRLLDFIHEGYFAFQDYAIPHWPDHVVAFMKSSTDDPHHAHIVDSNIEDAFAIFVERYYADLSALDTGKDSPAACNGSQLALRNPHLAFVYQRAHFMRGFTDDRQDKVSLPSLATSLERNRNLLESLTKPASQSNGDLTMLRDFYGHNWFKCSKLSCYYFHQGFSTQSKRQAHLDRHSRPFKCDQNDCPSAMIGFGSLKEMDKHRRNLHPGIDKLSSTFKRLKKAGGGNVAEHKYECPKCPLKFASRLQSRLHMLMHRRNIAPKESDQEWLSGEVISDEPSNLKSL